MAATGDTGATLPFVLLLFASACVHDDPADSAPADSARADTAETAETGDTAPTDDTGDLAYTHYMSTISGTVTLSGGSGHACEGEAHLNVYPSSSRLFGYGSCQTGTDAETQAGNFEGTVTEGVLAAVWTSDNGGGALEITVSGTVDATTLHAELAGSADWADFVGTVDGQAL